MRDISFLAGAALLAAATLTPAGATAQSESEGSPGAAEADGQVLIELNKLETEGANCRTYFVVRNRLGQDITNVKLDVFLFDHAQIIQKRVALNTRKLRHGKTYVRIFDLADIDCGTVGQLLLNEVLACELADGEGEDCAGDVRVTSRADVPFVD